jgi:hypothetical protein
MIERARQQLRELVALALVDHDIRRLRSLEVDRADADNLL